MKRNASAVWQGGLKDGKGTISTDSGVLANTQYSFSTRFEDGAGTNPEELIAAAHAGCFSMALSGQLGAAGLTAESINTTASVSLEKTDAGFAITHALYWLTLRLAEREPLLVCQNLPDVVLADGAPVRVRYLDDDALGALRERDRIRTHRVDAATSRRST